MKSCLLSLTILFCAGSASAQNLQWERQLVDYVFRSEGVAAGDFNKDGKMDIAAGDVWYAGPDWTMHEFRPVGKYYYFKGYSNSFCNWVYDINGDGWDDIIVVGFPGEPFHWYENPKQSKSPPSAGPEPGHWKQHLIWHSICNETPLFQDLTGDGKPEIILGSQPEAQMGYIELPDPKNIPAKWDFKAISEPGDPAKNGTFKYYHGLGIGDLNQDGRTDVIIPHGWWEAPEDRAAGTWKFHPLALSPTQGGNPVTASNIHVEDLDLDGDNDLILSSAHAHGVWWFENKGDNSDFQYHLIDDSFSQTHALEYADVDGDGKKDLITGKRFFAHQGNDPGGKDPTQMFWYAINRAQGKPPEFVRQEIVPGFDTGVGTQFQVLDFDGDGRLDVLLSNKHGVNLLVQKGSAK